MGLVPPAKAFHLQVATSKSDGVLAESSHSQLAFFCEQQLPLHFDSSRPSTLVGAVLMQKRRRKDPLEPPPLRRKLSGLVLSNSDQTLTSASADLGAYSDGQGIRSSHQ